MSLVNRVQNILMKPAQEWEVIAAEPATVGDLFLKYAIPLMLLPLAGTILALGVLGIGAANLAALGIASVGITYAVVMGIVGLAIGVLMLFAMSYIVNAVSPSFNGKSDLVQSTKLMTYASTPAWVAGFISPFLGALGGLLSLAAVVYVVYLIYLGLKPVLAVPQEKLAGLTVVIVLIYIVLTVVLSVFIGGAIVASLAGGMAMSGM